VVKADGVEAPESARSRPRHILAGVQSAIGDLKADHDAREGNWDSARSRLREVLQFAPQSTAARDGLQIVEARGRRQT